MSTAASPARLVLVIDPNAQTRAPYRTALPAATFDVEEAEDGREALAQRAYDLYRERGGEDGHDRDDWFQAEEELRRR